MKRILFLSLMLLLLMAGCKANYYDRVDRVELPDTLYDEMFPLQKDTGAVFRIDPDTGRGYLQVSVGEEHSAGQHLRLGKAEYDRAQKILHVYVEQFTPVYGPASGPVPPAPISSHDWVLLVRFRKFSFNSISVTVDILDTPGEQKTYSITRPFGP